MVREEFGRVAYSQKTHQKMVDRLNDHLILEKRVNAVLLAATTGGLIDVLVRDQTYSKIITLLLSACALCVTVYSLSRGRERLVEQHRAAAHALWLVREEYVHLLADLKAGSIGDADGRRRRDNLSKRAARIYQVAPDTDAAAYAAAQRALKENEELTFSTREIDLLLPTALREGNDPPTK